MIGFALSQYDCSIPSICVLSRSPLADKHTKYLLHSSKDSVATQSKVKAIDSCDHQQMFWRSFASDCSPAVKSKTVILAAETESMKKELEEFTKLPVTLFPHPIEAKDLSPNTKVSPDPITISCPGFARHEKGSDILCRR